MLSLNLSFCTKFALIRNTENLFSAKIEVAKVILLCHRKPPKFVIAPENILFAHAKRGLSVLVQWALGGASVAGTSDVPRCCFVTDLKGT